MGLKGLLSSAGMNVFAIVALVLFFIAFLAILIWTLTRSQQEIEAQSRLWEDDEQAES
jgi:cbb3-type cytochrome oxidase subunit 3